MNGRTILATGLLVALGGGALAQFKPEGAYHESPAVAERYPDPQVAFTTPAFAPGKADFTSQAEMMAFLTALKERAPQMTLSIVAKSQEGRDMPALMFTRHGLDTIGKGQRPVVMLIGQQHGNEPAGGEAMLVLAERLGAGNLAPLLDAIDVVIIPRGNPDGADRFRRALANGIDANRDHTQLRTPEIRAIAELFTRYRPDILLDCHEFTVAGRWVEKTGGLVRIDGMIQAATVPNLAPALKQVQDDVVLPALRSAFEAAGVTYDWYHTTDGANPASPVAMGSIGADTGRNIAGLRNAVSLLLETRGVGIGRAHLGRRVQAHVAASEAMAGRGEMAVLARDRTNADEAAPGRLCAARQGRGCDRGSAALGVEDRDGDQGYDRTRRALPGGQGRARRQGGRARRRYRSGSDREGQLCARAGLGRARAG